MRYMKTGLVLLAASATFLSAQDPPGRVGRLNYQNGPVSFQPSGLDEWVDADINRPLTTGDGIWVGDRGRAEIHIGSTALRLGAYSDVQFLNLDDQTVQIRLSEGTLAVRLRSFAQNQIFEVDTPNLAFTLDRPGDYRIDANPNSQTTTVTVRDGGGEVTGGGQSFPIYASQRVVVRGDDQISYNLVSAGGPDEFDQWSASRDRREDQSLSARYISREIPGYDDFDQYGRWGSEPGYGRVWMPTVVAAGWAPYHDGHWVWIAPWGWTWVDDAPWGFAPYHYGRWAIFRGRWGWIPGPYGVTPLYAPALVAWIGGGGFSLSFSIGTLAAVAWFPLGPREPYFPCYEVSQGYFARVNNTNTVINNVTINNYYSRRNSNNAGISYVNQRVQNGVTAVPQNTFASGHRVNQYGRYVPAAQLASVRVATAPAIAPQKESVLGRQADTASRAARPPANTLNRRVVARTAPPPAPVPFERQQPVLAKNPGRPLPSTEVRQLRQSAPVPSAPVRVEDMSRVRRVQPAAGGGAQGVPPQPQPQSRQPQRQQQPQTPQPTQPQPQSRQPQRQQQPQATQPQTPQPTQAQPQSRQPQRQQQPPPQPQPQQQQQQQQPAPQPQSRQPQRQLQRQPQPQQPQSAQPQPRQQQQPQPAQPQQPSAAPPSQTGAPPQPPDRGNRQRPPGKESRKATQ